MGRRTIAVFVCVALLSVVTLGSPAPAARAAGPAVSVIFAGGVGTASVEIPGSFRTMLDVLDDSLNVIPVYFSYNYPFSSSYGPRDTLKSFNLLANAMRDQIEAQIRARPGVPVVVVGHSLGGLVALAGAHRVRDPYRAAVRRAVTLNSPVNGFDDVRLAAFCLLNPKVNAFLNFFQCRAWAQRTLRLDSRPVLEAQAAALADPAFLIAQEGDPLVPPAVALGPSPAPAFQYRSAALELDPSQRHDAVMSDLAAIRAVYDTAFYPSHWRYRVSGYVRDARIGTPITRLAVGLHPAYSPPTVTTVGDWTDFDGFWSTMAPAGHYRVGFFSDTPELRYFGEWWDNHTVTGAWNDQTVYFSSDIVFLPGAHRVDRSAISAALDPTP